MDSFIAKSVENWTIVLERPLGKPIGVKGIPALGP
jgi:hypothetical protein